MPYPWSPYPVTGGEIRSAAQDTSGRLESVRAVADQVEAEHRGAIDAVEGDLADPIAGAGGSAQSQATAVEQTATYAAGCLESFAQAVDTYNTDGASPRCVAKLNSDFQELMAGNFGVSREALPADASQADIRAADNQFVSAVAGARAAKEREFDQEFALLEANLDEAATKTQGMLNRGPNEADIRNLWASGSLPMAAILMWPSYSLDVGDISGNGLPSDVAQMEDEEIADYLLDNPGVDPDLLTALSAHRPDSLTLTGEKLAEHVSEYGEASEWVWERLDAFSLNQQIAGGFVGALDGYQVARLVANRGLNFDDDDISEVDEDEVHSRLVTLGYLMAGASREGVIDRDFLLSFDSNYVDAGMNMALIGSLMRYGDWDKDTLKTIGGIALHTNEDDRTTDGPNGEGVSLVLKGISFNTVASAEFYDENFDMINLLTSDDGYLQYEDDWEQRAADFLRAATVGADSDYYLAALDDPNVENLAQANTLRLMEWLSENEDTNMSNETQEVYGDIAVHYMDDLKASVMSPTPEYFEESDPDRDGIEASDKLWSALLQEGMRNADVAGELTIEFRNETLEMLDRSQRQDGPEYSNAFTNAQVGHMENWFVHNVDEVRQQLGDEVEEWNENVDTAIGKGVDYLVTTGQSIASGNPAPLLIEGGKDLAKLTLGALFHHDPPTYDVDTDWANNFSADWRDVAGDKFESGQLDPVTVDGITWEGDPAFYEDLYNGDFTDSDGSIMAYDEMDADGRRAYMEWLQDPAVQNATYGDWSENQVGAVPRPTS